MGSLKYLNKYLYKYRFNLLMGVIFTILYNVFGVIQGPMIRKSLDYLPQALSNHTNASEANYQIFLYGITIIGTTLVSGFFLYFQRKVIISMSRYIEFDLKNEIYEHYQQLPQSFYKKNNTGDIMNRISEDVSQVRNYLGPAIMYSINMVVLFAVCLYIMIGVNSTLALYTIIPLPLLVITVYLVHNKITFRSEQIQKTLSNLSTYVQEAFSGIRVIKSFSKEENSYTQFKDLSNDYRKKSLGLTRVNALFYPIIIFLIGSSTVIIIWLGGQEVIKGNITYGNIAEFVFYLNKMAWPVASLGWITSMVRRAEVSQTRINEFLSQEIVKVNEQGNTSNIHGAIQFKNVDLKYENTTFKAVENLSFDIAAGESIAIVGNTGSGKSSIANLLSGLYTPTSGQILIDHIPLSEYNAYHYRKHVGYVPQDVFLFSESIKANIQFGKDDASEDEVKIAARKAGVAHNIEGFKDGYDTLLGERGITLSGGQKQRVSIARALIRDPQILILDDCLSAVDTQTEDLILNELKAVMQNKTSIIISHRLSSVKLVNRIMVIEKGHLIECGTHDELMAKQGTYFEMYQKQLSEKKEQLN